MKNEVNQELVSIIVPVYKVEKTIRRCIESILNQNYRNFELILIDDGSPDDSGKICSEYVKIDSRVRVIHKDNSGVSDSRNLALKDAKGKYIQFADSDDFIAPEATGMLVHAMEEYKCDMVISDFYRVVDTRVARKGAIAEEGLLSREQFAMHLMEKPADFYYGVLWNKMFKKDIIDKYELTMDPEISWCEDFIFNLEYIRHTKKIYVLKAPIYYYVKTKNSLSTSGLNISRIIQMKKTVFTVYNKFYKDVFNEKDYEKSQIQVYRFFVDAASDGIVPPIFISNSVRLGEEKVYANFDAINTNGFLRYSYLHRKVMESYLNTFALRNDITYEEAVVLLYIRSGGIVKTKNDLSDLTGLSQKKVNQALQKLKSENIVSWKDGNCTIYNDKLIDEIGKVEEQFMQDMFYGLSEKEIEDYLRVSDMMMKNISYMISH